MDSSTLESQPTSITHESPFTLFSMAISHSHIALGTFLEDYTNHINILNLNRNHNHNSLSLSPFLSFPHPYPPTKLMFHPSPLNPSLLASSSDFLRLYQINNNNNNNHFTNNNNNNNNITSLEPVSILNNSKSSEFCAPLTSFDWNELEPRRIGTSSIDTTCTIWDVEKGVVETQLIAHDKEVHDIAWGEAGVFASVSADGSVRVFDLRDKEHSTIIYESPQPDTPLLRLAWNKRDLRYMATILMDSNKIVVLDIRSPTLPVAELERHRGSVNAIAWAPVSGQHICSGGDDSQALIWDLSDVAGGNGIDPVCMYSAGAEINQVQWSAAMPDWIGIAVGNKMQLLKV